MKKEILLTANWAARYVREYENENWVDACKNTDFEINFAATENFYTRFDKDHPFAIINMNQTVNLTHYRFLRNAELNGVKYINSIVHSSVADDKYLSNLELATSSFKVPKTMDFTPLYSHHNLMDVVESEIGFPCILKPSNSSSGCGVVKINNKLELRDISDLIFLSSPRYGDSLHNSSYIIQEFIETSISRDIRIMVLNGECLGGMMRVSNFDWKPRRAPIPNAKLDNTYVTYSKFIPDSELVTKAIEITKKLNLNYAGLDVFFGDNEYIFGEINTNPGLYRFEVCHPGLKVTPLLLEFLKKQ